MIAVLTTIKLTEQEPCLSGQPCILERMLSCPKIEFQSSDSVSDNRREKLQQLSLAIVCPMANEASTARRFVEQILDYCRPFGVVRMFAVVDRVSRDATREILDGIALNEPRLTVVWAPENTNIVDAYLRGYREALASGADWILEIDAGFSHQPRDIPQFFPFMLDGYDCIFGSRFMPGGRITDSSLTRRIVSWGGSRLTNLLLGSKLRDMTSGFEMFTRNALIFALEKGIHSRAHFFQTEIKLHCRHMKIREVPIHYKMASPGIKGSSLSDAFGQLLRLFKERITVR